MSKENRALLIKSSTGKSRQAEIAISPIAGSKRLIKASLLLLAFLMIASFSVLIPLLHFILPPAFVIIGLILAVKTFRNKLLINAGQAVCPECEKAFKIYAKTYQPSFTEICEHCGRENSLTFSQEFL